MALSKRIAGLAVVVGLTLTGGVAGAQGYPGPGTTPTTGVTSTTAPTIPPTNVRPGETLVVDGEGCAPNASVVVTLDDGTNLGTFTADANGDFTTTITIPLGTSLGEHVVTATCGDIEQILPINVVAGTNTNNNTNNNTGGGGALPRTGSSNTGPLVGIGAAALLLGAAFVYGARRPRSA